jgi:hypothetical protein
MTEATENKMIVENKALCLETSICLFESDRLCTKENKKNGFAINRFGGVVDKINSFVDDITDNKKFIIGCAPSPFDEIENRFHAIIAIRKSLLNEFDCVAEQYLLEENEEIAKRYRMIIQDFAKSNYEILKENDIKLKPNVIDKKG